MRAACQWNAMACKLTHPYKQGTQQSFKLCDLGQDTTIPRYHKCLNPLTTTPPAAQLMTVKKVSEHPKWICFEVCLLVVDALSLQMGLVLLPRHLTLLGALQSSGACNLLLR